MYAQLWIQQIAEGEFAHEMSHSSMLSFSPKSFPMACRPELPSRPSMRLGPFEAAATFTWLCGSFGLTVFIQESANGSRGKDSSSECNGHLLVVPFVICF